MGDITRLEDVERCLRDADAVVHSCGLISVGINPDNDKLHAINVTGKIFRLLHSSFTPKLNLQPTGFRLVKCSRVTLVQHSSIHTNFRIRSQSAAILI